MLIALPHAIQYRRAMRAASDISRLTVVLSDLDGTLLDASSYSYEAAGEALALLKKQGVGLVLASSKTRAEVKPIRDRLGLDGPFIVENGGALIVPAGFFRAPLKDAISEDGDEVIRFGTPYHRLRAALRDIAVAVGVDIIGFGDLSIAEVATLTGLTEAEAALAKQREYDEPFLLSDHTLIDAVRREAMRRGLTCTKGGRFHHLLGPHDKGDACRYVLGCWHRRFGADSWRVRSIGVGDSANDIAMLAAVDQPVLVQGPDGSYDPAVQLPRLIYAPGIGPAGWNAAMLSLLAHA